MSGVMHALGVGLVLIDRDTRILGCCLHFARMVGRLVPALIGTLGWDLVPRDEQAAGRYLLRSFWRTGHPLTLVTRLMKPTGEAALHESYVLQLVGGNEARALSIVRPFNSLQPTGMPDSDLARQLGAYAADMGQQMARMTADAMLPAASDLFALAAKVAADEGGLGEVAETPA